MMESERKEYFKKYQKMNSNKLKNYRERNKKGKEEYDRLYRQKNKELLSKKAKLYGIQNRDKLRKYKQNYPKEKKAKSDKKYHIKKYYSDLNYRLKHLLRGRLYKYLLGNCSVLRKNQFQKIIGCSMEQLKEHLENQFIEGMSWENFGKWHIDHILPCCAFDLTKEEEQRICFNYTNLRPLWAQDNLMKISFDKQIKETRLKGIA